MAKNEEKKKLNTNLDTSLVNANKEYDNFNNNIQQPRSDVYNRGTQDYNSASSGYTDFQNTGGMSDEELAKLRGIYAGNSTGSGGGSGGVGNPNSGRTSSFEGLSGAKAQMGDFSQAQKGYQDFSNSGGVDRNKLEEGITGLKDFTNSGGGFDPQQLEELYGNIGNLSNIGKTGGITAEDRAGINRDTLTEFEKTGGYSDLDKSNIRARSNASAPNYFSAIKDQLNNNRAITGNLAGGQALDFKLARQAAQQGNQDRTNTEIGINDSVRQGRMDASGKLADLNYNLTGLKTGNQLRGAESAGSLGLNAQNTITGNRMNALNSIDSSNRANEALVSGNKLAGLGGLTDIGKYTGDFNLGQAGLDNNFNLTKAGGLDQYSLSQAQLAQAGAGMSAMQQFALQDRQSDMERYINDSTISGKKFGIGGNESLYNTNLGALTNYDQLGLNTLNSKYGQQNSLYGLMAAVNQPKKIDWGKYLSAAGSIFGSLGGGGGAKPIEYDAPVDKSAPIRV